MADWRTPGRSTSSVSGPWYAVIIAAVCASIEDCRYVELGVDLPAASLKTIAPVCAEAHGCDIVACEVPTTARFWHTSSAAFLVEYDGPDPQVVFIDADHSYQAARADFERVQKRWPQAIVFLHDTWPTEPHHYELDACGEVWQLREDLERDSAYELFTWTRFPGLTVVRNREGR